VLTIPTMTRVATLGGRAVRWADARHQAVRLAPVTAQVKGTGLPMAGYPTACSAVPFAQITAQITTQTIDQAVAAANGAVATGLRTSRRPPV
jgi:hypothetical protein